MVYNCHHGHCYYVRFYFALLSPLLCVIGTIFIDEQITHQSDLVAPYVDVGQVKYENPFFAIILKWNFDIKVKQNIDSKKLRIGWVVTT